LDVVELALAEVAQGKSISNAAQKYTKAVYSGMVKVAGASCKEAGVHFRLVYQVSIFGLLVLHGFDKGSQGFIGLSWV
jgi:phage-related protein